MKNLKPFIFALGIITSLILISNYDYVLKIDTASGAQDNKKTAIRPSSSKTDKTKDKSCLLESNFIASYIKMHISESESLQENDEASNQVNLIYRIFAH